MNNGSISQLERLYQESADIAYGITPTPATEVRLQGIGRRFMMIMDDDDVDYIYDEKDPKGTGPKTCRMCEFYSAVKEECRYSPPSRSGLRFPIVSPDDWCGRWE